MDTLRDSTLTVMNVSSEQIVVLTERYIDVLSTVLEKKIDSLLQFEILAKQ